MSAERRRPPLRPLGALVVAAAAVAGMAPTAPALAQAVATTPPDAGSTLQQLKPLTPPPVPPASIDVTPPASAVPDAPGGPTVTLRGVQVEGATLFSQADLQALLADAVGTPQDLAGLRALADRITLWYREAGYPFVRTVLPPQDLDEGRLRLQVIEGRYGRIQVHARDATDASSAARWLSGLVPGAPIATEPLTRATLLLDELPGVRARAVLRPGDAFGQGNLVVDLEREPAWVGGVQLDNQGNRYSGARRLQAQLEGRSLWRLGDRVEIEALASDADLLHGSLAYGLPLGADGWRARVSMARTGYELGREFASLQASGQARVLSAGLSFAALRSIASHLTVQIDWQDKQLDDRQDRVGAASAKRSQSLPITLRFDHRDTVHDALSWGALTLTSGRLRLDAETAARDRLRTQGHWQTVRVDAAHLRPLAAGWALLARASGQWADHNLDASEGFTLGGAQGVRAYPAGEAPGDAGWLVQLELRRKVGALEPFVFHDHGRVRPDQRPVPGERSPDRTLAGAGVGLRATQGPWQAEALVAWRTQGGAPTSSPDDARTRIWFSVGRQF